MYLSFNLVAVGFLPDWPVNGPKDCQLPTEKTRAYNNLYSFHCSTGQKFLRNGELSFLLYKRSQNSYVGNMCNPRNSRCHCFGYLHEQRFRDSSSKEHIFLQGVIDRGRTLY